MMIWFLRGLFVLVLAGIAALLVNQFELSTLHLILVLAGIALVAAGTVTVDLFVRKKNIAILSALYIGVLVGLGLSNFIMLALRPFTRLLERDLPVALIQRIGEPVYLSVSLVLTPTICYLCISFLLQTRGDFRFIIPYVEFSKEMKGTRPLLLDTSVIIDGRIADLAETRLFDAALVVPGFVLQELQMVADSADKLKRNREIGRAHV